MYVIWTSKLFFFAWLVSIYLFKKVTYFILSHILTIMAYIYKILSPNKMHLPWIQTMCYAFFQKYIIYVVHVIYLLYLNSYNLTDQNWSLQLIITKPFVTSLTTTQKLAVQPTLLCELTFLISLQSSVHIGLSKSWG